MTVNLSDYNALKATLEYQRDQLKLYKDQLLKRDSYYSIKVIGNYWLYGSEKAVQATQDLLFELQALRKRVGDTEAELEGLRSMHKAVP